MKVHALSLIFVCAIAACSKDSTTAPVVTSGGQSLRVINGNTTAVDVLVDGTVTNTAVPAGQTIMVGSQGVGPHIIGIRAVGGTAVSNVSFSLPGGETRTVAAHRASNGSLAASVLDDTASIVPAGATKLRVLHLSPNTGELQVYRTQPDYNVAPVRWQFPFNYQTDLSAPAAPFYQSTPGTWEVRIWQTPASADGWANALIKFTIPLGSGERKTIVIVDKPGGGFQAQVIE